MSTHISKACAHCGDTFRIPGSYGGGQKYCTLPCAFWSRVDRRTSDECWPWVGGKDAHGYGAIGFKAKKYKAHRVSLDLKLGRSLPPEECATHSCDNPICVNPNHLRPGSRGDNVREAHQKGRGSRPPRNRHLVGEASPNAKLTTCQVLDLLRANANGESVGSISRRLGVKYITIYAIVNRTNWRHLWPDAA